MEKFNKFKIKTKKLKEKKTFVVPKTIKTACGTAYFVRTDVENKNGRWRGDNLKIKDGYWIIHRGNKHDIYKTKPC